MKSATGTFRPSSCIPLVVFLVWALLPASAQDAAPAPGPQDLARMADLLKEAQDLQSVKLAEVPVRLAPLLAELRQLQQSGSLTPDITRIFQDALLLQISTQTKLLAPEQEIIASFRELLVVNPKLDESGFNPREKLLLEKVRSAETGQLSLKTNPAAALVLYGGTGLGISPLEIPLISGTYRLLLRREGYRDDAFDATIRPSELLLAERTLRRRSFLVPLSTNVEGATVLRNGQLLGKTRPLDAWIASLPPERQQSVRNAVGQWGSDPRSAGFFSLPDATLGTRDGLPIPALADWRIQILKRQLR